MAMSMPWKILVALVLVWAVAGAGIYLARSAKPTPEKIARYLEAHPVWEQSHTERTRIVERVAADLNRLTFEQRQELRRSGELRSFVSALTPGEQELFIDLTLPEGFRQMMEAFNRMEPERRQRMVQRALDDIERAEREGLPPGAETTEFDEQLTRKIVSQGLEAFYTEANAEVKMELAPVIERLQRSLQNLR